MRISWLPWFTPWPDTATEVPPRDSFPSFIAPMMAKLTDKLPEGEQWTYEVKWDGYRALLLKSGDRVRLLSRKDNDLTAIYPTIEAAGRKLEAETAILDGEIVALDPKGKPSFQALQHRSTHRHYAIVFYAFDLLHLNGDDLTGRPLTERRKRLPSIVKASGILLSEPLPGNPQQVIEAVSRVGLEGVIAKRKDSRYQSGERSGAWVKLKLDKQQEFVIGGYRPGPIGIDALLVGYYEGKQLRFAGKVRAGFTPHLRREVFESLERLQAPECPFVDLPNSKTSHWGGGITAEQMPEMTWVKPKAIAQVRFVEWTNDGHLRHAAFLGLRSDKRPSEVRREA
jgi:bifunctional non-homologous end joining protein LigD